MDTTYTDANMAHRAGAPARAGRMEPTTPSTTDALNRYAMEQLLIDLALVKRTTARRYTRKRHALRMLVKLGVFTPEQARGEKRVLAELVTTWRAARSLLLGRV